jgi:VanZ family protein
MKNTSLEYFWPPLIVLTVFVASGQSQLATPGFSFSPDKLAHFAVFGALATSVIRLERFRKMGWKGGLGVWVLVAVYGGLDEFRQSFTPGRSVEFDDWLADALGAAVAVILYQGWPAYRRLLEWVVLKTPESLSS